MMGIGSFFGVAGAATVEIHWAIFLVILFAPPVFYVLSSLCECVGQCLFDRDKQEFCGLGCEQNSGNFFPILLKFNNPRNIFEKWIRPFLSPTTPIASYLKTKSSSDDRAETIKRLNSLYLCIALASVVGLWIYGKPTILMGLEFVWGYYLLSRCNEIFYAFLKDALDKAGGQDSKSNLTKKERLVLALKSYLELVINFAILYFLMPSCFWKGEFCSILDALYFSGVTITTLGYGDIAPENLLPKLLTVYEVLCGFILLIVCFAIYTSTKKEK